MQINKVQGWDLSRAVIYIGAHNIRHISPWHYDSIESFTVDLVTKNYGHLPFIEKWNHIPSNFFKAGQLQRSFFILRAKFMALSMGDKLAFLDWVKGGGYDFNTKERIHGEGKVKVRVPVDDVDVADVFRKFESVYVCRLSPLCDMVNFDTLDKPWEAEALYFYSFADIEQRRAGRAFFAKLRAFRYDWKSMQEAGYTRLGFNIFSF